MPKGVEGKGRGGCRGWGGRSTSGAPSWTLQNEPDPRAAAKAVNTILEIPQDRSSVGHSFNVPYKGYL